MSIRIDLIKRSNNWFNPKFLLEHLYELSQRSYTEKTIYLAPYLVSGESVTPKIAGPVVENLIKKLEASDTGYMIILREKEITVIKPPLPFTMDAIVEGDDTGLLEDIFDKNVTIGIVLIRLGRYAVAVFERENIVVSKTSTRHVKNRHRAGGSSQRRFERSRERLIRELFDKTCEVTRELFDPFTNEIKYVFFGGEKHTVRGFQNRCDYISNMDAHVLSRLLNIEAPNQKTIESISKEIYRSQVSTYEIVNQ
jgi:hypothetical protein